MSKATKEIYPFIFAQGDKFPHPLDGGDCNVMAVSGRYVMARRPHCMPFVITAKDASDSFMKWRGLL